jgi:hypothetical protein
VRRLLVCNVVVPPWLRRSVTTVPPAALGDRKGQEWLVFDEEQLREYTERELEGLLEWDRALLRVLAREALR